MNPARSPDLLLDPVHGCGPLSATADLHQRIDSLRGAAINRPGAALSVKVGWRDGERQRHAHIFVFPRFDLARPIVHSIPGRDGAAHLDPPAHALRSISLPLA